MEVACFGRSRFEHGRFGINFGQERFGINFEQERSDTSHFERDCYGMLHFGQERFDMDCFALVCCMIHFEGGNFVGRKLSLGVGWWEDKVNHMMECGGREKAPGRREMEAGNTGREVGNKETEQVKKGPWQAKFVTSEYCYQSD